MRSRALPYFVLLVGMAAGCAHRGELVGPVTPPGEGWPGPGICDLMPGEAAPTDTLTVALGDTVRPDDAPVPLNQAERIVFANLYETLTRVDCAGRLVPGLAERWERQADGARWVFILREDAHFWDGTPVTASAVITAWRHNQELSRHAGRLGPGLWVDANVHSVLATDARHVVILLPEPQDDIPRLLAHPALAVAATRRGWTWPVGTGPCRLSAESGAPAPDLVCRPHVEHPDRPVWRRLVFHIVPGADARDLMPRGVDVAVIRDRGAAAYYRDVPGVASAPLPWDRLLVLLTPPRMDTVATPAHPTLEAMSEATAAEARPWERLLFHTCESGPCPQLAGPIDPGDGRATALWDPLYGAAAAHEIMYAEGDVDARAIAERVTAFAGADRRPRAVPPTDLAAAIASGTASGYVVTLRATFPTACLTLSSLLGRAAWLQAAVAGERADDPCVVAERMVASGVAEPLVQTRARLVWRGHLAGLRLGHDGTPWLATLGRARPGSLP